MISEDEKTPAVPAAPADVETGRPLSIVPRRPPPGRPSSSVTIAELIERVTREVRGSMTAEIERRHGELRAEVTSSARAATSLAVVAVALNVVAFVVTLGSSRVLPAGGVGLALAALTALFLGAFAGATKGGLLRGPSPR